MRTFRRRLPGLFLAAGLVAALPQPPAWAQGTEERAEQAREVLRRRCLDCHGNQKSPRAGLKVLDHQQLMERQLVRPDAPDTSELLELVECGSMPPGRLPKVPEAEQQILRDWIAHGAPPFPPQVGDAYVLRKIARDLEQQREKDPSVIPFLRYVSFNHLVSDTTAADPQVWRAALARALNHLSWKPDPVRPVDIEPTHSVFRIDLRDLGWDARPFVVVRGIKEEVPSQVNLFDLVLLEYPFGTLPGLKDRATAILGEYLAEATPVRPVVYVRGDWLVSTITRPPLYEDLLRLPRILEGLEKKLGVATLPTNEEVRAGFADTRAPGLKRLVSRLRGDNGPYWRMWDVYSDRSLADLAREGTPPPGTRDLQVLFGLPNGLQGYFLADNSLRLVDSAPRESLSDPLARDQGARNGLSCILCHDRGLKPLADSVRPALERANLDGSARERLLALYPPPEVLKGHLDVDSQRFTAALKKIQERVPDRDPLAEVTRRFLAAAPSHWGMPVTLTLAPEDRGRKSAVRPSPWEESEASGPAVPAVDGLTHPAQEPLTGPLPVTLQTVNASTGQPTTVFTPGDQMQLLVTNTGDKTVYFELTTTLLSGEQKVLVPVRPLGPREQFCHPRDTDKSRGWPRPREFVRITDEIGKDWYTVYAAAEEFPRAQRLQIPWRARNHTAGAKAREKFLAVQRSQEEDLADRLVHPLYELSPDRKRVVVRFDPSRMMKKTIVIETRPGG